MVASVPPPSKLYRRHPRHVRRREEFIPIGTPTFWAALVAIAIVAGMGIALACIADRLLRSAPALVEPVERP